jgi:alanyl-tRNA synthetase
MHEPFLYKLVPAVEDCLGGAFPEIKARAGYISSVIESEEASFGRTLDRGIEIFNAAAKKAKKTADKTITGDDAFQLYDTYGFPLDLTQLMAQERVLKVDTVKFNELMEEQRERARAAITRTKTLTFDAILAPPATDDSPKYAGSTCDARVVGWVQDGGFKTAGTIPADTEVGLVLDKTCFYAEAGGQVGDCGTIKSDNAEFVAERTEKIGNYVSHWGRFMRGRFLVGEQVKAIVSKDRDATRENHTATHLLQWALQQVVSKSAAQQGSLVSPDYLRFDFTCPAALTSEQIEKVERLVNEKIAEDLPLTCAVLPRKEADKLGAMALFGEKYGSEVRVVAIGADSREKLDVAFSREFCGGTHVDRTGCIGGCKIIKEESISAGVRRITALTGRGLNEYLNKQTKIVDELAGMLKVPADDLINKVGKLVEDNKRLSKELKSAARQKGPDIMEQARQLLEKSEKIGDSSIVISQLSDVSVEQAREAIDMIKKKAKSAAVVFGFAENDKVTLLAGVTDDLIAKGLKAGDIIKQIAPIVDGGGGGRPQMAQAGGKNPAKIAEALEKAREIIKTHLAG